MSALIKGIRFYHLKSFAANVILSIGEIKGRKVFTGIAVRAHAPGKSEKKQE